jgi:hypothetical protein
MAQDVSRSYGTARAAEPLTDQQQTRLRELARKNQHSAQELYELGALKGQARSSRQGRQVLEDVGHEEQAAQGMRRRVQAHQPDPTRQPRPRSQARSRGNQGSQGRMPDAEWLRNYRMLGEHLREG